MDEKDINDIRISQDFKYTSFDGFQKNKVKLELIKNIVNNKIEPSCFWSIQLICAGHFIELWEVILLICSKYIHTANPKLPIYIQLRYSNFKEILINGYIDHELKLRNNNKVRKLFAEIITNLCLSPKKLAVETIKIDPLEFDITLLSDKLKADKITYCSDIFRQEDPKQLFIPLNEFCYNLNKNNNINCTYWLEWFLQFDQICKSNKVKLLCETRSQINVPFQFQKDTIWLIWESIFNEANLRDKNNKIRKKILNSLLELYCIKFTYSCKRKRKSIIYFAISLITELIDFEVNICKQPELINNIVNKIDTIYKELKKNEHNPKTDYLFTNVKKDNFDKSISKIEMMNQLEANIDNNMNENIIINEDENNL